MSEEQQQWLKACFAGKHRDNYQNIDLKVLKEFKKGVNYLPSYRISGVEQNTNTKQSFVTQLSAASARAMGL